MITKNCVRCGTGYQAGSNRAKYCPACKQPAKTDRERSRRAVLRKFDTAEGREHIQREMAIRREQRSSPGSSAAVLGSIHMPELAAVADDLGAGKHGVAITVDTPPKSLKFDQFTDRRFDDGKFENRHASLENVSNRIAKSGCYVWQLDAALLREHDRKRQYEN